MSSVTCLECKSEIPQGVDLCPECGFHFADAPPIKCPECSNVVVFRDGTCPECGFPYDALDELLLEEEVADAPAIASQAEQLPAVAKHAAAASAAQAMMEEGAAPASVASPERGQLASLNDLIASLAGYLEEFRRNSDGTVGELSAGVEKFLENAERLQHDNQSTLQGMQEIAGKFGEEMRTVVDALGSAKAAAVAEISNAAQQGKADLVAATAEIQEKVRGTVDYVFYISLAIALFAALNIAVTMYVVKLVK